MIFTLLSKIVSGAVVGYITNDLAIQMLFRKRFGLGGIVIRTKDEFIANVSKLVEREIINHHTIEKEINQNPELLIQAIAQISDDFFNNQLYLIFPEKFLLAQIKGIEESYQNIKKSEAFQHFQATPIVDFIFTHTPIALVLSESQLDFVVNAITDDIYQILDTPKSLHRVFQHAYQDINDKELVHLLNADFSMQIQKNIVSTFYDFHQDLQNNFALPITESLQQINNLLEINTLIGSISQQLAQKKLYDIFGENSTDYVALELNHRLLEVINSKEGRMIITSFTDFLLKVLENEKTTIFELLSDDLANNFDNFLHAKLPIVLKSLIAWLEERKEKLELLIDSTFKKNIKSRFQDLILRFFIGSVSQYANIVKKMTEIIDQHRQNPEETANRLTDQLINFLKSNTIGDIITQLKNNPTFNQKVDLGNLLLENLVHALETDISSQDGKENSLPKKSSAIFNLATLFDRTLGELVRLEEIEKFLHSLIHQLTEVQLKNQFLYHERFSQLLMEKLANELTQLLYKKLNDVLPWATFDKFSELIAKNLYDLLQSKQTQIVEFFKEIITKQLKDKTFADYITPRQIEKWNPFIVQATENLLDREFEKLKQREVRILIQLFNQTDLKTQVPVFLENTLIQHLPNLLKGKVEMAVSSSMQKMNADKLRDLVEKFMGKELKPITAFGAFLGAVAGGVLYMLPSDNLLNLMNLGIASAAYGITGYSTNWLALKMIFRPYQKKYFPFTKIPVPFTPGVAAKNQARFAQNMGKFVVNGLLNKAHLTDTFLRNKVNLGNRIIEFFSANDFEFLRKQVEKNKVPWSQKGGEVLFDTIHKSQDFVNQQISKLIRYNENKSIQDFGQAEQFISLLERQLIEYTESERFQKQVQNFLYDTLRKLGADTTTLDTLLSTKIKDNTYPKIREFVENQLINLFKNLHRILTEDLFTKEIIPFEKYSEKNLNYYINATQKENLKEKISTNLRNKLIDNEIKQVIFKFIDNRLSQELNPQKKINELFAGNLIRIIQENMDSVVDNLIKFGMEWLGKNKDNLADLVYEKAYKENKATALYKDPIKNTVKELAEEGIPFFFKKESTSLKELVAEGVHQIGESPLAQLKLNIDNNYLKKKVDEFLVREEILEAIQRLLDLLLEEVFKLPITVFLKILSIHEASDLQRILRKEMELLATHLTENGLLKSQEISGVASTLLLNVAEKHLAQIPARRLLEGIEEDNFQEVAKNWVGLLLKGESIQQIKNEMIADFLSQIRHEQFGQMLNSTLLQEDIAQLVKNLLSKESSKLFFSTQFSSLIEANLTNLVENISPETKHFLIDRLTEAALKSLENNLDNLLGGIDLKKIVESEVSHMQPKEIESLFYSFADRYFTQLINYGFGFGIVFGLLIDFIFTLAMLLLNKYNP